MGAIGKIMDFLGDLRGNNNREWFQANKERYLDVQQEFNGITRRLISGVAEFEPSVAGLDVKECTWRIYRDIRFSQDKKPYKTHIGAYVCPRGKNSGFAGYYFHLEADNSFLAVGLYMPDADVLASVRDEFYDNGEELAAALKKAKGFRMDERSKLKKATRGYNPDSPYIEFIKLKEYDIVKPLKADENAVKTALADFRSASDFARILTRCVQYTRDVGREK